MHARVVAATLMAALGSATAVAAPPSVAARAYIVVDPQSGAVLAASRPDQRMAMASTTKLMTAIVTLQHSAMDRVLTVPAAATAAGGSTASLVPGERIAVRDLMTGLLVGSGNDAAIVLAGGVGGSQANFVAMMNRTAASMGLRNTHFVNPHGLDAVGHYSTVRELVTIGRYARERFPFVKDTVRNRVVQIPGPNGVGQRRLESENDLLAIDDEADGIKTGHTDDAGYALVGHATSRTKRMGLYVALIGSPSRDQRALDAKRLLDWGFRQFARPTLLAGDATVIAVPVRDRPGVRVALRPQAPLAGTFRLGSKLTQVIAAPPELVAPLRKGAVVGTVTVKAGSRVIGTRKLVVGEDVDTPSVLERVRSGLGRLL